MYTALWFMLKWIYDEFTSKHGNNKTFFLDSVHCDLIIFQCADQVNSGGFRQRNHSEMQSEWLCKWMHFITWLQNSCTSHPTRPDLWFVTFPCNGCWRLFNTITASHHLISLNLIERNEKQLTTNLYTHTPTSATQNTNTHTHRSVFPQSSVSVREPFHTRTV